LSSQHLADHHPSARPGLTKRRRFDDEVSNSYEETFEKRYGRDDAHRLPDPDSVYEDDLDGGDRWSTWDQSSPLRRGPKPYPDWLPTEYGAIDTELGILKTGKEADVYLIRRGIPNGDRSVLLAAKRYRGSKHRLFHRDAGYLEGRQVRESRDNRAMAKRTAVGMQMIAGQWADAEFTALRNLCTIGVPVPYPVQILGTEILLEFIGDHVTQHAAPRLAQLRPEPGELADLWDQLVAATSLLARAGYAHGDLSAYNVLVQDGRLVLIDVPQIVDVVAHPQGREYLIRDARNVATWFAARGLDADGDDLARELILEANIR
jgi:RIO kinase 1